MNSFNHFKICFKYSITIFVWMMLIFQRDISATQTEEECNTHRAKVLHPFMSAQCVSDHRDGAECNKPSTYGIPDIKCSSIVNVQMHGMYSHDALENALEDKDSITEMNPPKVLRVVINNLNSSAYNELAIEKEIDRFLTYRPWWKLVHDSGGHASDRGVFTILFERYPFEWRSFLEFLMRSQFLPSDKCLMSPMIFGRMSAKHPGLMPVLNVFSSMKKRYPYAIFMNFWPISSAFVSESDCDGILNKWECAFLPMTNCTIPSVINNCRTEECLKKESKGLMWSIATTSASNDATIVDDCEKEGEKCGKYPLDHLKDIRHLQKEPPHFNFLLPHNKTLWRIDQPDTHWGVFTYLFMTRPNAFFRVKMRKNIHEMRVRSVPHFTQHAPCVTVHIRRGDRIVAGVDMLQFCANVSHDKDPANVQKRGCVQLGRPERFGDCPFEVNEDLGCKYVPFEAVRLKHVISKIPSLVDHPIYDLLIFSDDPIFIHEQAAELAKTDPKWRIHTLKSPELPANLDMDLFHSNENEYGRGITQVRFGAGTESGILFQSSLRAAQQCHAFIGHFGSGVASLFYHAMCVEHGGRYGVCPPAYDFRWGLW